MKQPSLLRLPLPPSLSLRPSSRSVSPRESGGGLRARPPGAIQLTVFRSTRITSVMFNQSLELATSGGSGDRVAQHSVCLAPRRVLLSPGELQRWEDDGGCTRSESDSNEGALTMKWVTRARPKVDRIACPWLIKRFVDPEAEFLYASANQVLALAEREQATAYDVPGAELGHRGDECSFDAIVRKYDLARDNPALQQLALIVRGADTDQRDLTPESRGLLAIAQGFSETYADDHEQLAAELPVYDALYAWCRIQTGAA